MSPPPLSIDKAAMLTTPDGRPVPLLGVSVTGKVFGAHARVVLRQRYRNAEKQPIEAIYTFPVPSQAALVGFAMECAGRRVEAEVKEREEAFRAYDDAVSRGHGAALLEEERRNVFTASVGNLLPGEETVIEVVYVEPLAADEGALRFVVPTVVAPRYIPGSSAPDRTGHGRVGPTDQVPDADRITPAIAAVSYGLTVDVLFDLGREITVESPSHAITIAAEGAARRVTLKTPEAPLDRDLVLTASGAAGVAAGVVAERRAAEEGTFALTVVPDLFDPQRRPFGRDVVFVVDVSGSMEGDSLREAKSALRLCLRHLAEGDRFQIIAFSDSFTTFRPALVPYNQRSLGDADGWVEALATIGGTEMMDPLLAAARALGQGAGRDRIIVLLTDGQVGNEKAIADRVSAAAGGARIYTFGIGTAVSDLLLRDLARRTRGAVELIYPGERIDEKVTAQFARATAARVEGLTLRFSGVDAGELSPGEIGDLVDGEPWTVFGRYAEPGHGRAELRGTLRGQPFFLEVPMELPAAASREGLTALWATARIRDLEEAEEKLSGRRAEGNRRRIVELCVAHRVSSKHASFVLVEKRSGDRRAQGQPEARPVPVSAPAGWAMTRPALREEEGAVYASMAMPASRAMPPAAFADDVDLLCAPEADEAAYEPAPFVERAKAAVASLARPAAKPAKKLAPPAPPAFAAPPATARSKDDALQDPLTSLFARQLAGGLWEGDREGDEGRAAATERALAACAAQGIDSAHAVYGAQVKKAVEALCALARGEQGVAAATLRAALTTALRVASGRRLLAEVKAAIEALAAHE